MKKLVKRNSAEIYTVKAFKSCSCKCSTCKSKWTNASSDTKSISKLL